MVMRILSEKKKLYISDLKTQAQRDEYSKLARLNSQGKYAEFSRKIKIFIKKHDL